MSLRGLVEAALKEDLGSGDVTTLACIEDGTVTADVVAKQALVVSGQGVATEVYRVLSEQLGREAAYRSLCRDGEHVARGDTIGRVTGDAQTVLMGERLALNFLMRLSGIATNTDRHAQAAGGAFRVVDTRKTTPLHRSLEKAAVRHGGGYNHRFGLYDGVMIKDNHIVAAGGIGPAVAAVRAKTHHLLRIEVEVTSESEAREAISAGADVLLLDNFDDRALESVAQTARQLSPQTVLEASGNMTVERIAGIREMSIDIDIVSVGGLIHQATWVDLSMKMVSLA